MAMKLPELVVFGEALTDFIREDEQHWLDIAQATRAAGSPGPFMDFPR